MLVVIYNILFVYREATTMLFILGILTAFSGAPANVSYI